MGFADSLKNQDAAVVDITEFRTKVKAENDQDDEDDDPDATEYSSSFAGTLSSSSSSGHDGDGNNNRRGNSSSDAEVDSHAPCNASASPPPALPPTRNKSLTSHWRSFIHPLMWRCKWAELRIKQFESLAVKYDKNYATYNWYKHLSSDRIAQGLASRSLPLDRRSRLKKAMKRRKRKRVEETIDKNSYMSNHILFSYREHKKSDQDGASMTNNLAIEASHKELGNKNDAYVEDKDNDLEDILRKIDSVHARVQKMKAQLDVVMSKNVGKFSSSENLSQLVAFDAQTSYVHSPTFSCNGDAISAAGLYATVQQISEDDMGDIVMPEGVVSCFPEAIPIPDIIESTMGISSSVDVTQHQSQIGDSCEAIVDNILVHNQPAEEGGQAFVQNHNQAIVKHEEPQRSVEEASNNPAPESDSGTKTTVPQEQSGLESCLVSDFHFPMNKRKRGERKAGTGAWSRHCSVEHDSQ